MKASPPNGRTPRYSMSVSYDTACGMTGYAVLSLWDGVRSYERVASAHGEWDYWDGTHRQALERLEQLRLLLQARLQGTPDRVSPQG